MKTIGRKDQFDFPDLEITELPAKIDTGAYGCALHCHHIEVIEKDGAEVLRFKVLDPGHSHYQDRFFYAKHFSTKRVKSSVGKAENRFAIKTRMIVFGKIYTVTFTLTNRKRMRYPVLIGRKFLKDKFVVDVALKDLSFEMKNKIK